jgi:hypothetical protein
MITNKILNHNVAWECCTFEPIRSEYSVLARVESRPFMLLYTQIMNGQWLNIHNSKT